MLPLDDLLNELAAEPLCGYAPKAAPATEPSALAALVLWQTGRKEAAFTVANTLTEWQAADGSLGVSKTEASPNWPTSLAVLVWLAVDKDKYAKPVQRAVQWILSAKGEALPRSAIMGHDTELVAWSWAANTHSWMEPTAFHVLALRKAGHNEHPRVREAVRLLIDRQLPSGGCNYGNTLVLGQELRPHVQPSGVTLLALAGEKDTTGKVAKSVAWLASNISEETTAGSLAFALLGLVAHDALPLASADWLGAAYARLKGSFRSPYRLALLCLAAQKYTFS